MTLWYMLGNRLFLASRWSHGSQLLSHPGPCSQSLRFGPALALSDKRSYTLALQCVYEELRD